MEVQKFHFQKLTPQNDIVLGIYDDAIEYAFANNDICNIAISGAYGAGKSSVIESYKRQHPDRKLIHISLAHFTDTDQKDKISEADLEGKIINQLVHQIPFEKIPQTNFAVKKKVDADNIFKYTLYIMVFVLLLCFICFHNTWCNTVEHLSEKLLKDLLSFSTKKEAVLIGGIAAFCMLCRVCYEMIKQQMNRRIFKKLNVTANHFNMELFSDEDATYFDKYLNEVLYLFENVDADAVVFEDMDRYNTNLIFEKLREINTLLNRKRKLSSEREAKPFRFIFLLRDDMFSTKERTKFFDYIIPVVPVIDGSNSYNMFLKYFGENNITGLFDKNFLQELSLYVDDMRVLKNIANEFLVYHGKLKEESTEQNHNKLLAMITYKNIFPRDFVDLQTSRGYVYQLFQLKEKIIERETEALQKKIAALANIEEESNKEFSQSLDELDAIFYVENQRTRVNGKSADQFTSRAEYVAEIKKNDYIVEVPRQNYYPDSWTKINIKNKFDALSSNTEYMKRRQKIENRAKSQRTSRKLKISRYKNELEELKYSYLKDLITRENEKEVFENLGQENAGEVEAFPEIKKDPYFRLIKYLIRYGYIDETYPDYMTFFYENSISRQDKIFLRSITDKHAKDYDYLLDDPRLVISKIRLTDFEEQECWNYNLLDALLKNPNVYKEKLKRFWGGICSGESSGFVDGYISHGKEVQTFVNELNRVEWCDAVGWIIEDEDISEESRRRYILATLYGADEKALAEYNSEGGLAEYINQCEDFLDIDDPDTQKLTESFKLLGVKFALIDWKKANKELLQEVYSNNMYQLTQEMIHYFLENMYQVTEDKKYRSENLTLILSQEQPLAEYVKENLGKYITMQLEAGEMLDDDEDTALYVLNEENLDRQTKTSYISILITKLSDLSAVTDKELWPNLIRDNIVDSSKNIFDYFYLSGNEMDDELVFYINKYKASLAFDTSGLDDKYGDNAKNNLFWAIIKSNNINNDKYRQMLKSFHLYSKKMSGKGISKEKMQIVIQEKIIRMSPDNLQFLRANYPDSVNMFIEENAQDYIDIMTEDELAELISEKASLGFSLLKALCRESKLTLDDKKILLANAIPNLLKWEVRDCLGILHLENFDSLFEGKRPTFEKTKVNQQLLAAFHDKKWISRFETDKENENLYRAYGRKMKEEKIS